MYLPILLIGFFCFNFKSVVEVATSSDLNFGYQATKYMYVQPPASEMAKMPIWQISEIIGKLKGEDFMTTAFSDIQLMCRLFVPT